LQILTDGILKRAETPYKYLEAYLPIYNGARGKNSNCAPFKILKDMFISFGFGFMDINFLIHANIYIR
jgi:hypothetical protein